MIANRLYTLSPSPLTPLELMRDALRLFAASFVRSLPYALVPITLLFALAGAGYGLAVYSDDERESILYLGAALLVLCPALMTPLMCRIHAFAHERPMTASEAMRRGLRCFLPCLAGAALFMLAVGTGAVLLLLPGLYLFVALSFWWPALVVDGLSPWQALRDSLRLVRGHWWHVVFGFCYIYPVVLGANAFDVNMVSFPNEIVTAFVAATISVLVMTLVPMFASANMVVIYHDLALRRGAIHGVTPATATA